MLFVLGLTVAIRNGKDIPAILSSTPNSILFAKFQDNTIFDEITETALNTIWVEYENYLLSELFANSIAGAYGEFGIWKGDRIKRHHESARIRGDYRFFMASTVSRDFLNPQST